MYDIHEANTFRTFRPGVVYRFCRCSSRSTCKMDKVIWAWGFQNTWRLESMGPNNQAHTTFQVSSCIWKGLRCAVVGRGMSASVGRSTAHNHSRGFHPRSNDKPYDYTHTHTALVKHKSLSLCLPSIFRSVGIVRTLQVHGNASRDVLRRFFGC